MRPFNAVGEMERLRVVSRDVVPDVTLALREARSLAQSTAADKGADRMVRWQARIWLERFADEAPSGVPVEPNEETPNG